ncbi:MAG: hypothetical protein JWN61_1899 [Pseudonocardiales bacterium]|nr:hypothetical protein [Jatrophihabitantaceae bacterium]MCW2603764.1 hypothetical protein [Pseudonocardiales bacterium]
MELVLELIVWLFVQVVVEIIGEFLWEGATRTMRSRAGRLVVGVFVGFVGGLIWGIRYTDLPTYPKTLWVSLALAAAGIALAAGTRSSPSAPPAPRHIWRDLAVPPWAWPADRLMGLALLNVAIAAGVLVGYLAA